MQKRIFTYLAIGGIYMQKRIFTYLAIGGIYVLALFTRFGEIVNLTIGYTFTVFAFSLFILFLIFYVPKKKTISFDISIILQGEENARKV